MEVGRGLLLIPRTAMYVVLAMLFAARNRPNIDVYICPISNQAYSSLHRVVPSKPEGKDPFTLDSNTLKRVSYLVSGNCKRDADMLQLL